MTPPKKKTGLGVDAFFQNTSPEEEVAEQAPPKPEPKKEAARPPKQEKIRTTITLYANDLALIEELKVAARRRGNRTTVSDILSEAITHLAKEKGIQS